jgi:large subunit ribosomal protein L24
VKVISGAKDKKGKVGQILEICVATGRVKVEGIAPIKRHIKPQKNPKHPEGGIVSDLGTIHLSNVMLMSESHGRPVRLGVSFDDAGKKVRVARGRNVKAGPV